MGLNSPDKKIDYATPPPNFWDENLSGVVIRPDKSRHKHR